jgi:hypothetical protein
VILVPAGWILASTLGGRVADPSYRNDEDLYTLLALVGGVLILAGIVLIIAGIHRVIRKVQAKAPAPAATSD